MLTLQRLKEMPAGSIFASGLGLDGRERIRWVACRGDIHDWCIYYGKPDTDKESIAQWGEKFFSENKIKEFVPCEDEAFKMYRY